MTRPAGLIVVGTIELEPSDRAAYIDAVSSYMAETRQVDGCLHYSLAADIENPNVFRLRETWVDQPSFDAHLASARFAGVQAATAVLRIRASEILQYTISGQWKLTA